VLTSKRGSTVAQVIGDAIKIIREGEIPAAELKSILSNQTVL
jgi:tRNA A37 threonylcarbamoyladenosine synthetase subunit TsaC/SUA5/YrdC